jgi:hypothetical protein
MWQRITGKKNAGEHIEVCYLTALLLLLLLQVRIFPIKMKSYRK